MTKRPSICFVSDTYAIGGVAFQNYLLAKELAGIGWEVHFTAEDLGQGTREPKPSDGIVLHKIKRRVHFAILGYNEITKEFREIDPDIYYQMGANPYTAIVARYAKLKNRQFIWSSASSRDCEKHGFIQRWRESKGRVLTRWVLLIEARINDWLVSYGIRQADAVVVQAQYQQSLLKENFNIESTVVKDGHPVPSELPPKINPPMVLWVSNIKRLKQAEIFIRLAEKCIDLDCTFMFAGHPQDRRYLDELLKLMEGLPNIKYIGGITYAESNEIIARASVLVNTSEYEGFPNTFVQAWMRKTPTVSLNVDPDDIIARHQLGFHSRSFDQLVRDVRLLVTDKNLRLTMGQTAYDYGKREHDITDKASRLLSIISAGKKTRDE